MRIRENNVIRITTSLKGSFFRHWLLFLKPFHHLADREMEVAAAFLKQRHKLGKVISDNKIIGQMLFSEDSKKAVLEECNITVSHYQVILGKLRKNKFFVDGDINPKFIPDIEPGKKGFQLLFLFELEDAEEDIQGSV